VHGRGDAYSVDVREYVESDTFSGYTKRGIRLSTHLLPELIDLLHDAWSAEGAETESGAGTDGLPPALVLGMRAIGESVEAIANSCESSQHEVIATLRAKGGVCPRCSAPVPTHGPDAFVCAKCSANHKHP
jgi:hypothetical protein